MAKCGQKCEVFSRAVGYYRPTSDWNVGKREEFTDRGRFRKAGDQELFTKEQAAEQAARHEANVVAMREENIPSGGGE